jgi:hypothetical protein
MLPVNRKLVTFPVIKIPVSFILLALLFVYYFATGALL